MAAPEAPPQSGRSNGVPESRLEELSSIGAALSSPIRFGLGKELRTRIPKPICASEYAHAQGLTSSIVAHHLRALRKLGIVEPEHTPTRRGSVRLMYRLGGRRAALVGQAVDELESCEVGKALAGRFRVRVVVALEARAPEPLSAAGFCRRNGLSLSSSAYHFRVLRELGVTTVVSRRPRRGAFESFHALNGARAKEMCRILALVG